MTVINLYVVLGGVALLAFALAVAVVVWLAGRSAVARAAQSEQERALRIKDAQLHAGLDRPDDAALDRELRDGRF
jgi:membrane protein required for beta-lactamase induction